MTAEWSVGVITAMGKLWFPPLIALHVSVLGVIITALWIILE
jgi:hypothetical protein